jgi:hypothetical protein
MLGELRTALHLHQRAVLQAEQYTNFDVDRLLLCCFQLLRCDNASECMLWGLRAAANLFKWVMYPCTGHPAAAILLQLLYLCLNPQLIQLYSSHPTAYCTHLGLSHSLLLLLNAPGCYW